MVVLILVETLKEEWLFAEESHDAKATIEKRQLKRERNFNEKQLSELIRTFLENISSEELKWRFDNEDRIIRPLNETNWQYQSDNQLPILLENNKTIYIPKGKYHRLIKGSGELKVEISTKGTY